MKTGYLKKDRMERYNLSTFTTALPCATAVAVMNEIEARQAAFQLVVPCEYKPG